MSRLVYLRKLFLLCFLALIYLTACGRESNIPTSETAFVIWSGISNFEQPVWSPDGASLTLKEFKYPEAQEHARLFLYEFNAKQLIPLDYAIGNYAEVSWSPDNTRLVGAKLNYNGDRWNIETIDLATQRIKIIGFGEGAAWAPNGRSIAVYVGANNETNPSQFSINLTEPDGILIKSILLPISSTLSNGSNRFDGMSWSPDSQKLVFSIMHWSPDNKLTGDLYTLNVNGNEFRKITSEGWNRNPIWSPNGETIAYISMKPASIYGQLYLVKPDGSCPQQLGEDISAEGISWSPDGNRIGYEYQKSIYIFDVQKKLAQKVVDALCP